MNKSQFVAIMEPMVSNDKIEGYKRFLGFQHCVSNDNGKIWCFWTVHYLATVIANDEQQITIRFNDAASNEKYYISSVYAKCSKAERKDLWESLEDINRNITDPWCIGGDFNVIVDPDEKLGGKPHRASKSFDFISCMDNCGMADAGFVGPKLTWCNNRGPRKRIWKRLDRIMINNQWAQNFQSIYVTHLVRTGSDHRPLLFKCHSNHLYFVSYFRFLNFWTEQKDFMDLVKQTWNTNIIGNLMWRLQQKLKILSKKLSDWSRITC
ncbi:uncharacterized protein LOC132616547 [Lycium barbarum]|uniref:uncharacterized protein LOC132616547 n=1 Tax=Lycium barbarum TaxID=112863 RepID=UPI00293F7133|nr:uncharacterized protein LOC132616547 [Lycium barbarum]